MANYTFPDNTDKLLYLDMDCTTYSFDDIFERISDHFGADKKINQFNIRSERIKITGCSCHSEYSDYNVYLIIELIDEPHTNVCDHTMQHMTEERP